MHYICVEVNTLPGGLGSTQVWSSRLRSMCTSEWWHEIFVTQSWLPEGEKGTLWAQACSWLGGTKVSSITIPLLHKTAESGFTQKPEIHSPSRTCWGNEWQTSWAHSPPSAIWGPNSYRSITASLLCAVPGLTGTIKTLWHDPHNTVSFELQAQLT